MNQRHYLLPHQIDDNAWYSLSSWDYRIIAVYNTRPVNRNPYPNIVVRQGVYIKSTGLAIWQHTPVAPETSALEAIKSVAPTTNIGYDDYLKDQGTYQGHASDGSGIQKHSCGGLYPYVIFAQDTIDGMRYGVIGPKKPNGILVGSYDQAVHYAIATRASK